MEINDLRNALHSSFLQEINSLDTESVSLYLIDREILEDFLAISRTQLSIFNEIHITNSSDINRLQQEVLTLSQQLSLVTSEISSIKVPVQSTKSLYHDLIQQRDLIEKNLVGIKNSHAKCQEDIDNTIYLLEIRKKEYESKEKELKVLLDELKALSEPGNRLAKPVGTPKKIDMPKMEIKSFPASSYSFNFGIRQNQSKDRIVLNRSLNNGEKSSRSSNLSNNTSMVMES